MKEGELSASLKKHFNDKLRKIIEKKEDYNFGLEREMRYFSNRQGREVMN
jgi:hypothetical protein